MSNEYAKEAEMRDVSPREQALRRAIELTTGPRNKDYGPPTANMQQTADLFNAYLKGKPLNLNSGVITAEDICVFMILAKLARLARTPAHEDSWTDIAAYSAMGHEVTQSKANAVYKTNVGYNKKENA